MKIAVISDIHCNLLALKLALQEIKKEKIDKIIYLGDYITDGIYENEILEIVNKTAMYAVLGNREQYILDYSKEKKEYNNYKTISYTYNNLTNKNIKYIQSLKKAYEIKIMGYKFLLIHGDSYYKPGIKIEKMIDSIEKDYDFDICLFGHTHKYYSKEYKGKLFINPGSLGQPIDGKTYKYCIIEIDNTIKYIKKEINIEDSFAYLLNNYRKSKYYKDNKVWGNLILHTIKNGKNYCSPFLKMFRKKINIKKEINVEEYNKIWDNTYQEFINKYQLEDFK